MNVRKPGSRGKTTPANKLRGLGYYASRPSVAICTAAVRFTQRAKKIQKKQKDSDNRGGREQ